MIACLHMVLIGWLSSLTLGISSHQKVCGVWILKEHVPFMFRTGVVLVIKQMYPKSLEIGKMRRTDCRGSHPAGESEGSFPSVLRMFVFQQERYCSHIVKLEGRAAVPGTLKAVIQIEPQNRDHCCHGRETMEPLLLLHIVVCWLSLLFVRLHSRCWASQSCSWRENSSVLIHMSFSDFSFSLEFYFPPFPRGKKRFMPFLLQGRQYQCQTFTERDRSKFRERRLVSAVTTPLTVSFQIIATGVARDR